MIPVPRGIAFSDRQTFAPGQLAMLCRSHPTSVTHWARDLGLPHLPTLGGHRRYRRNQLPFLPPVGADPQLLTFTDLADLAGVTPRAVQLWADKGQLECVALPNGRRRIWRSEADRVLSTRTGS